MTDHLETFFSALENVSRVAAEAQRILDRELAAEFSAIKLLRPDENRLSDSIACLLDPSEAHGQGSLFLDLFVNMFEIPCINTDDARCRVAREQGRLDILVEIGWRKPFGVGIENKPRAGSRDNQVLDHCVYLQKQFPERWWFAYLSGNGNPPPEHSIKGELRKCHEQKRRFRTIPYVRRDRADEFSVEEWLARCVEVCIAERVKWFLRDLLDYVRRNFNNSDSEFQP